jgi:hypothetical protein
MCPEEYSKNPEYVAFPYTFIITSFASNHPYCLFSFQLIIVFLYLLLRTSSSLLSTKNKSVSPLLLS